MDKVLSNGDYIKDGEVFSAACGNSGLLDALLEGCTLSNIPNMRLTGKGLLSPTLTVAVIDGVPTVRMIGLHIHGSAANMKRLIDAARAASALLDIYLRHHPDAVELCEALAQLEPAE